jgi:hypothetical protein
MTSFQSPQPSPSGVVLSLARALGIVSSVDDVVIVPLSQWHAMQEQRARADQNERDRRDAVARALVAEAAQHALEKIVARQTARADAACRTIEHRDERIRELNAWLDSHAPMVTR